MQLFTTKFDQILNKIDLIDPYKYAVTRNFKNGHVTKLSPYISRGVISTRFIYEKLVEKGFNLKKCEKFIQELAWRDFWQQIWLNKRDLIDEDLKRDQEDVNDFKISKSLVEAKTGIDCIDEEINNLYEFGYMHNHMRMYVASIATNIAKSHWKTPAKWMYYHLLDGDWASNSLSWQWVAGSNSNKKYYANQENVNKYFNSNQKDTFLDNSYEIISSMNVPDEVSEKQDWNLMTIFSNENEIKIDNSKPTLLYNYYNIDPNWRKNEDVNRVLIFEPKIFKKYPVSQKCIDFSLSLSKNIKDIQIFFGDIDLLSSKYKVSNFIFKEHPLNLHYNGEEDKRDWLYKVEGEYLSFFKYWNKIRKKLI
tara:strand:+ start:3916 stop:5007 length:1092 start_codon:yes stop_codon:yes gene_type:complete